MLTMFCDCGIVYIMSIIVLLITGFLLYWLIRHPIKSLGFIFKIGFFMALGFLVWCGILYCLTVY